MNQVDNNIKVKIDSLVNSLILQVIINSNSQSLLHRKGQTEPSPEEIDKMFDNLSEIGLDDSQLPFPDPKENSNGLSLSPANDILVEIQLFKKQIIKERRYSPGLIDGFYILCDFYFRHQYKKKGVHNFCQDYKKQYISSSSDKRDEIDRWLCALWTNGKYPLESIRLFVEQLNSYCKNKEQDAHSDTDVTKRRMEKDIMPEIEHLKQEWKKMNVITRFFKGKKFLNEYVEILSYYYLHQLQIESNDCLSSFFYITRNSLDYLQTTVNMIYNSLNENEKLSTLLGKKIFGDLALIIEEEHLSLSDMGMRSMTEVLTSLQQASYPKGSERMQRLREKLSHILINQHLHQFIEEQSQIIDTVTDDMGVVYTPDKSILLKAPKRLERYHIPNGVVSIFDFAFSEVTSLVYIKIPEGVCSIGSFAFQGCSNLKEIILPKSVIQVGDHAFCGCTQLESATFLYRNISLNDELFKGCPALKKERIETYNSVITGWEFDTGNKSGTHKATGIKLKYCYDNGDGTIRTELVGYPTHVSNLLAQGYSEKEVNATFREVGREFVIICKSLY